MDSCSEVQRAVLPPGRIVHVPQVMARAFGISRSEATRIIDTGGVRLDDRRLTDQDVPAVRLDGKTLEVGAKRQRLLTREGGEYENPSLVAFVRESNGIEGIWRDPYAPELLAHEQFMQVKKMSVPVLESFVRVVAPGHRLRDRAGLDVRVGSHVPPPGGREIRQQLRALLDAAPVTGRIWEQRHPVAVHREYETLHPFTDGNGRSGRVLWAWHMQKLGRDPFSLRFLHCWYYETLGR